MGIESTVSSGGGNHSTFEAEEGKAEQDTWRTLETTDPLETKCPTEQVRHTTVCLELTQATVSPKAKGRGRGQGRGSESSQQPLSPLKFIYFLK